MPFSLTATVLNSITNREYKIESFTHRQGFILCPNGIRTELCQTTTEISHCVLNKACCVWVHEWRPSEWHTEVCWQKALSQSSQRPVLPTSLSSVWWRRLPLYGILNASRTAIIGVSASNERNDICPVPLLCPDKQGHSSTASYFTVLLFCMQNLLTTAKEKVWHLLSDIYLTTDYSTRGV